MFAPKIRGSLPLLLIGALLIVAYLTPVWAEVVLQGASTPLPGPAITVNGNVGQTRGNNLFHTFSVFNILRAGTSASGLVVPQQESVTFTSPTVGGVAVPITNVINRVTGGTSAFTLQKSSLIDGPLNSSITGANFWFINPNGIIFGSNAVLPTTGSFHASTADYIKLADGNVFGAKPVSSEVLTVAPPSAFGFLAANPAGIQVVNASFQGSPPRIFQVPAGRTLSLVGGTIDVGTGNSAQGFLLAPAGRLNLVSVASAGEATFDPTKINGPLNTGPDSFKTREINVDNFTRLGDINIRGAATGTGQNPANSLVDAKEIFIRSGNLTVDNSLVAPGIFADLRLSSQTAVANGGQVEIRVDGDVTITGNRQILGFKPGIQTYAGDRTGLVLQRDVPSINIKAGSLSMSGLVAIQTNRFGPGNPPTVLITADTIEVRNGAVIGMSNSFGGGALPAFGGSLTINGNNMTLSSDGSTLFTGINTDPVFHSAYGQPGVGFRPELQSAGSPSVTINLTGTLTVRGNAVITTDSLSFGPAGNINVNAANILLVGAGPGTGRVSAQGGIVGTSGSIRLNATGKIDVQNGFQISAGTGGSGLGGIVDLAAGESITLTGAGISSATLQLPDQELNSFARRFDAFFRNVRGIPISDYASLREALGVAPAPGDLMQVLTELNKITLDGNPLVAVTDFTPGDAGRISITTPLLTIKGTSIETSTGWGGNAGAVVANVGSLFLNDGAAIRSTSGIVSGIGERSVGAGNAGSVMITATDAISISASTISTTTLGDGNAGNISLRANKIDIQNSGRVTSESGGTLAGQFFVGSGNAREITISTPTLTMGDGGAISVKTSGGGNAGNISLNVGNFTQAGGASVDSSTLGAGRGGDLTVTANSVSISGPGTGLFSTASGSGAGGNIRIQAGRLVQLSNEGTVSAHSTGAATATAGDININTPTFQSQNGSVTTGATLADGGNISISTTGSLVRLTDSQITTSVESGVGSGGNIAIDSKLIVLDNSQVLARAIGGTGGNINITGDVFLVNSGGLFPTSLEGIVDPSSALSTPGTVNIEATFTNITGTFAQLPSTPLQATELLRASCAARLAGGKASSLVLGGRDGLPLQPGDLLPSPLYAAEPSSGGNRLTAKEMPLRFTLLESKDRLLNKYSLLPNARCSL